jgi:serine/threonine protein kinase
MSPDRPLAPGTVLEQRYRIKSLVGQGGMSRVYLADAIRLHVTVAIKENVPTTAEAYAALAREAQLLAHLAHPNIPRVLDRFNEASTGRQYLVMEYVEGEDLATMIARVGPIPEAMALGWMGQILDAVEYLHHQTPPIILRDIKPANIKITLQGRAVLVDFGVSSLPAAQGGVAGVTAGYAPSEQYGLQANERSDIYALGATLYTMVTGRVPPEAPALEARGAPLDLNLAQVQLSPSTEAAIAGAMDRDPSRRWVSAGAMRAALRSGPVQAAQPAEPQPRKKPGLSCWMVAIPIVTIAFILGLGLVALMLVPAMAPFQIALGLASTTPTATTTSTATATTTSTATATTTSTATATFIPTATATASPTGTSTPSPTPTLTLVPTRPAPSSTPPPTAGLKPTPSARNMVIPVRDLLVRDEFDNASSGWLNDSSSPRIDYYENGEYHIVVDKDDIVQGVPAPTVSTTDYAIQVEGRQISGDNACYGLAFRRQTAGGTRSYYTFETCADGTIRAEKFVDGAWAAPLFKRYALPDVKRGNEVNRLLVVVRYHHVDFYLNGATVGGVNDDALTSGGIGLLATANKAPTEFVFDNFYVWSLP